MDSVNEINSVYPGKAEFILVGDGPRAKQLKENSYENVAFTGYLRGEALSAAYASADVFIFPSSTETFGNVVLEAMASGLPVIAVSSGGVMDSVIHEYNGLLCEARDNESLVRGIERFLKNKNLIASMGINAKKYLVFMLARKFGKPITDKFVSPKIANKYGQIIESKSEMLLIAMFLLQFFPDDSICFLAGLSKIKWNRFLQSCY